MTTPAKQPVNQHETTTRIAADSATAAVRQPFVAPKLTFITPKLTKRGDFADLTEGFFGGFTPPNS